MLFVSAILAPATAVALQALAPAPAVHAPPTASRADTVVVRVDSAAAAIAADTAAPARVAFDLGGGLGAPIAARALEFGVSSAPGPTPRSQPTTTTRVRFVRAPDALSAELTRRVASGERLAAVDAQLQGRGGSSVVVVLHLFDVQVVSTRLVMNDDDVGLRQQRLALEESIAQLGVDLEEARRQLTVAESLEKRHLASSLDLARARGSADALATRLAVQQERLALVAQQLAHWTPIQEEVVLSAGRTALETH